jgi:hypothetical protein
MALSSVRIIDPLTNTQPAVSGTGLKTSIDVTVEANDACTMALDYSTAASPPATPSSSLGPVAVGSGGIPVVFKVPAVAGTSMTVVAWAYTDPADPAQPVYSDTIRIVPVTPFFFKKKPVKHKIVVKPKKHKK